MDPLATNAETFNDEWEAKELARPLGTPDEERVRWDEEYHNSTAPFRTLRWYRAIRRLDNAYFKERAEEDAERKEREAEEDAERKKERAEEEERAREAAEERALERARTHGLRDAAGIVVFAQLGKLAWNYVGLCLFLMLMPLGLDAWRPIILVLGLFFVIECLGNGISFGLIHDMVGKRFDPIAAWVLTVVAVIAANETTVAMLPAEVHGLSPLRIFVDIITR